MSRYLSSSPKKSKTLHRTPTKDSRLRRMKEEQVVHKIKFDMDPENELKKFEETVAVLFGVKGIGKTSFAAYLGDALTEKYDLDLPATYFLMAEPVNNSLSFRKSRIKTWPTFRDFVDKAAKDSEFVSSVKMWIIDDIDTLVARGISTIAYEWGIIELSDEGYARAWHELRAELIYQLIRLREMGPGLLLISHEKDRPITVGRQKIGVPSMNLSDSICSAVGDLCSTIMRMKYITSKKESSSTRCISVLGSEQEDVKDNCQKITSEYPDGIIKFKSERQAVRKILDCFDTKAEDKRPKKKFKKFKKSKKRRS